MAYVVSNSHLLVDVELVKSIFRKLKSITKKNNLERALIMAENIPIDKDLEKELGFLKVLVENEASGKIIPPINLSKMYEEVVVEA